MVAQGFCEFVDQFVEPDSHLQPGRVKAIGMNRNWIVFIVIACGLAILAVSGTLLGAVCTGSGIVDTGETWGQCARGWLGAMSGWVAAFAAGATIVVLLHQIRSNAETVHKNANEAKFILEKELGKILSRLNTIWKGLEDTSRSRAQTNEETKILNEDLVVTALRHVIDVVHRQLGEHQIAELLAQTLPLDKARLSKIISSASYATSIATTIEIENEEYIYGVPVPEEKYIQIIIERLQYFYSDTQDETPFIVEIFANREKQSNRYRGDPFIGGIGWAHVPNDNNNPI